MNCRTPGCVREATVPSLGICGPCYSSELRWSKESEAKQIQRLDNLRLYESRMDVILPTSVTKRKFKRATKPWNVIPGQVNGTRKAKKKRGK